MYRVCVCAQGTPNTLDRVNKQMGKKHFYPSDVLGCKKKQQKKHIPHI